MANPPAYAPVGGNTWMSGLFDFGNLLDCIISACFGPCVLANARENFDGSSWCFNCMCGGMPGVRQAVRHGYNIQNPSSDECLALFCVPCSIAQVKKEVEARGRLPRTLGAHQQWLTSLFGDMFLDFGVFMYGWFCPHCAMSQALHEYDGTDCCYAFCCISPVFARSVIRHGHNIEGDCCGDICAVACCGSCAACQALNEVRRRNSGGNGAKVFHN